MENDFCPTCAASRIWREHETGRVNGNSLNSDSCEVRHHLGTWSSFGSEKPSLRQERLYLNTGRMMLRDAGSGSGVMLVAKRPRLHAGMKVIPN